ncbi:MAG: hypothetical protein M1829_002801 [Trizodia sp. TS-e1964]|nr:MAG: hypothetical protein M1829_002801 [Trizodia sp. TS-e1964]
MMAAADPDPSSNTLISLQILSPSNEVPSPLCFSELSISTTVGMLKARIKAAIPTSPDPTRQRLIHRGRMLGRDADTLLDVFGHDLLHSSSSQSLHLVLRPGAPEISTEPEAPPTQAQASSRPNGQQTLPGQQVLSTQAATNQQSGQLSAPVRNNSRRNMDRETFTQILLQHHQQQHELHFTEARARRARGTEVPGESATIPIDGPHAELRIGASNSQSRMAPSSGQSASETPHHQQLSQGAAITRPNTVTEANSSDGSFSDISSISWYSGSNSAPLPSAPSINTPLTRTANFSLPHGPDQQIPSFLPPTSSARAPFNPFAWVHYEQLQFLAQANAVEPVLRSLRESRLQTPNAVDTLREASERFSACIAQRSSYRSRLIQMLVTLSAGVNPLFYSSMNDGTIESIARREVELTRQSSAVVEMISSLNESVLLFPTGYVQPGTRATNTVDDPLAIQRRALHERVLDQAVASHLNNFLILLNQARPSFSTLGAAGQPQSQPHHASTVNALAQHISTLNFHSENTPTNHPQNQIPSSAAVYLLSSPTGPNALLVSPTGIYTVGQESYRQRLANLNLTQGYPNMPPNNVDLYRRFHPAMNPIIPGQAPLAPRMRSAVVRQENIQQNFFPRDFAARLIPHFWSIARWMIFVYVFAGTGGWRRLSLLIVCATLGFAAQVGLFNGLVDLLWGPLRRYLESLLPTPDRLANGGNGNGGTAAIDTNRIPEVAEAATRLVQNRQIRNREWLLRNIRRFERIFLILLASLVPGVGERHVAARDRQVEAPPPQRPQSPPNHGPTYPEQPNHENDNGDDRETDGLADEARLQ